MNPLLSALGASDNTIGYAKQYLFFVVVIGSLPTILSATMSADILNVIISYIIYKKVKDNDPNLIFF